MDVYYIVNRDLFFPNSYDKIIFLYYPEFSGGRFLLSSLGLSDEFVFQNSDLAKRQCENNFSLCDKLTYIDDSLTQAKEQNKWNDFNMSCNSLWGVSDSFWHINFSSFFSRTIFPEVNQSMKKGYWLPKVWHSLFGLMSSLELFPNSKIINFYNYDGWIQNRIKKSNITTNRKIPEWNNSFSNRKTNLITEYENIGINIVEEIEKEYSEMAKLFYSKKSWSSYYDTVIVNKFNQNIINWDVEWYNYSDKFLLELKSLYEKLGLTINWTNEQILDYRKKWLDTIL